MIFLFLIRKIGFQPRSRNIYENHSSAQFPLIFSFRDRKSGFWMSTLLFFMCLVVFFNRFAIIFFDFSKEIGFWDGFFYWISVIFVVLQSIYIDFYWFFNDFQPILVDFSIIFIGYTNWFSMLFIDFSMIFVGFQSIFDDFQLFSYLSFEKSDSNCLPETYMKIVPAPYSRSSFRSGTGIRVFGWLFLLNFYDFCCCSIALQWFSFIFRWFPLVFICFLCLIIFILFSADFLLFLYRFSMILLFFIRKIRF